MIGTASDLQRVKLDPQLLAAYAGWYEYRKPDHPENPGVYTFSVAGEQLSLADGPSTYVLTTLSRTAFATTNGVRFEFFRDDGGVVSHVIALTFDGDIQATRRQ
jgi:hypothetical protein